MSDFITGSPARGDDFYFRTSFLDDLWDSLRKEHVLLLAPRRMGKTSVMLRLQDQPRQDRLVVFLNVEEICMPADFCQSLIVALHDQHPEFLREALAVACGFLSSVLDGIDAIEFYKFKIALRKSDPDWAGNWLVKAEELIDSIRRTEQPMLIILDEVPDMVLNMQKRAPEQLEAFLHWFRKTRQDPKQDNIRWLVGGSINLTSTLDQLGGLNLIIDFRTEPLPPFTEAEVEAFICEMFTAREVCYDPDVLATIKQLLGKPIPFFLQLLAQELYRAWRRDGVTLTSGHVQTVFNRVLLGETARDKLQYYHSRIRTYYTDRDREAAMILLNLLSLGDEPLTKEALFTAFEQIEAQSAAPRLGSDLREAFNTLMLLLQNDFYIEEVKGRRYAFACKILKLWWCKHYG